MAINKIISEDLIGNVSLGQNLIDLANENKAVTNNIIDSLGTAAEVDIGTGDDEIPTGADVTSKIDLNKNEFATVAEAVAAVTAYPNLYTQVRIKERANSLWDVVTGETADGYGVIAAGSKQLKLVESVAENIVSAGAVSGTDSTLAIKAIKDRGRIAEFPKGSYTDTRNGEFYLYSNTLEQIGGFNRWAVGGTLELTNDPRPVFMIEKTINTNYSGGLNGFDAGPLYFQLNKKSGDAFAAAGTAYVRSTGGSGDAIAFHSRAQGSSPGISEIFGGWDYADINPTDGTFIFQATGREINVNNRGEDVPFNNRALPPGSPRGDYRGLTVVTADGSGSVNVGIDIGAQRHTSSKGFYTGLRLREDGIEPSSDTGEDTCAMRVQGATSITKRYGAIHLDFGNFDYGFSTVGAEFGDNRAIELSQDHRIYFSPLTGSGDKYLSYNGSLLNSKNMLIGINGTQVVGTRKTGWSDPTGTPSKATFATSTVTTSELAAFVFALYNDLKNHGLVGA